MKPAYLSTRLYTVIKTSFLMCLMVAVTHTASAQDFNRDNHRVDSLMELGLPKSALEEVAKSELRARKVQNTPQLIQTAIYRMLLQSYITDNALVEIIDTLKGEIGRSTYPVKPVLQSLLGSMYYNYYQQNRWYFSQRTRLEKPSADITKWDLKTIVNETSNLFRASLSDAKAEQATPIDRFNLVLKGDALTRNLRPTLYDLLLHRALSFYLLDEPAVTQPRLPFSVNDARFFSDSRTFAGLSIKNSDTASVHYQGLKYLQQATLFHALHKDTEALADLDIQRLEFLFRISNLPDKDSLYLNALRHITRQFNDKHIVTDALVNIGKYYQSQQNYPQALIYLKKATALFPHSLGGQNAAILIRQIEQKSLSVVVEDVNLPGEPLLGMAAYKSITTAKIRIFRLTQNQKADFDQLWSRFYGFQNDLTKWVSAIVKNQQPVQQKQLELPDLRDYKVHHTEFKIDALERGSYLIWVEEANSTNQETTNFAAFNVSGLAYTNRVTPDDAVELKVTNRKTGEPIKNAHITISGHIKRDNANRDESGLTDKTGGWISHNVTANGNTFTAISFKGDTLINRNRYLYHSYFSVREEDPLKTVLFTDRSIYRPGQTIYFKGIQLERVSGGMRLSNNDSVSVQLDDVNGKVIKSLTFKPNEFGSFSGSFVLPQNMLTGQVKLYSDNGYVSVRVEEYKRPTFKAELKPVTESYKLNDSVTVKGNVTAFSGYGLSQAKVAYHITRSLFNNTFRYMYTPPAVVKTDTIQTDQQGQFQIKFKATAGDAEKQGDAIYNYYITLDATDAAGETHSASISFKAGNNNIAILNYLPANVMAKDTAGILAGISNLNNHKQKGTVNIKVYALQNPAHLYKSQLWQQPDVFTMSREDYHRDFPYTAYGNEDDPKTWTRLNKVMDTSIIANDVKPSYFYLNALHNSRPGIYQLVLSARNENGDTTTTTKYFNLVSNVSLPPNMAGWLVPVTTHVKPNTNAEFLVGINEPVNVLMEKYSRNKILDTQWLHLDKGQHSIKVPVLAADSDVSVQFVMTWQNRLYSSYQRVTKIVADNNLRIQTITFRDKLQPGDKDQWKLQLTAPGNKKLAAEMVASLYDASLDAIANPVSWYNLLSDPPQYPGNNFGWNVYDFVQQVNSRPLVNRPYYDGQLQSRQYEELNLGNYNYYGGYNQGFHNYTAGQRNHTNVERLDKEMEAAYQRQAASVKDGFEVTGQVTDSQDGQGLPGVSIKVKGTSVSLITNSQGRFKVKVPAKSVLDFMFIGYDSQSYTVTKSGNVAIVLHAGASALNEVAVIGYGQQAKRSLTGAVTTVRLNGKDELGIKYKTDTTLYSAMAYDEIYDKNLRSALAGKVAGIQVTEAEPDGGISIQLRGSASIANGARPLMIVDGMPIEDDMSINPNDIAEFNILDASRSTELYGAKAINGVIVISTKSGRAKALGAQPVKIRTNFNETAFFYPHLRTNDNGEIIIDLTMPDALTSWKFRGFAHTADLQTGYIEREIVTQKQLSITANTPRFLREGDTITVSARLVNLTSTPLKGKVTLKFFNALSMQPANILVNPADAEQDFETSALANKAISFKIAVPAGLDAVTYRLTAEAGLFSDGEENTLAVLPNRMLVTESMPMMLRAGQTRSFTLDKLVNPGSSTLKSKTLTLEYTQNPTWYAVQALPYMMEFPYECSEQIFSRYYANTLASGIIAKMPVIKKTFNQWKSANSGQLLSTLEKNQELKATLLEETPWLRDALNETEQKKRIAMLFDLDKMGRELADNLDKLKKRQLPDGGFPWFGGNRSDAYISRHIAAGIGQLYNTGLVDKNNKVFSGLAENVVDYVQDQLLENYRFMKKNNYYNGRHLAPDEIHAYYALSYFNERSKTPEVIEYLDKYLMLAQQQWLGMGLYTQGMVALTLLRNHKPDAAQKIIRSLTERAVQNNEMGMYWPVNRAGYFWYESPVETQCLMIELYTEAGGHDKEVEEMKVWLLRNKQTQNWKTTKATAAACYALLLKGSDWLADTTATSIIKINGENLDAMKPEQKADAGTGYFKTSWAAEQVKPAMGNVSIANNGKTISWGAMYWQYLENLDKITPSSTDIHIERKYFILKQTDSGPVLTAIDATHVPKTGDVVKVVVYLKAGRDYEYVQLKDMRPSGTEPMDALSGFKYQDGLGYYQATKDAATNFFISQLPKGSYVFEYQLRVVQPGNFSTGISTVQCMYAPEFSAHSNGGRMVIR